MLKERDVDFFRPLWRRLGVVGFCLAWAAWEWSSGETFWGSITLAIAAYGIWVFFISFDKDNTPD